ncbi:MAG: hypothetical protein WCW27_01485 [Patescibacteria group bacterium]|jgi:hypothetical protein
MPTKKCPTKKCPNDTYHHVTLYFGIAAAITMITTLPISAAVQYQKQALFDTLATLDLQVAQAKGTKTVVTGETAATIKTKAFEQRQQAVLSLLDQALTALTTAEEKLQNDTTIVLSAATKKELQTTIDATQKTLESLKTDVGTATSSEQLVQARQEAAQVLYDSKAELKDLGVDVYTDGVTKLVEVDRAAVGLAQIQLGKYKAYNLNPKNQDVDTALYEQVINTANTLVTQAEASLETLTDTASRETYVVVTEDVYTATMAVYDMQQVGSTLPTVE